MIKAIRKRESQFDKKKTDLVIATMKELNEVYYQKRGFVTGEKRFEKGVGGGEVGFSVGERKRTIRVVAVQMRLRLLSWIYY